MSAAAEESALPAVDPCDHCEGPNAQFCCSRCKCMYYCCKECQVAAWTNGHKQECKGLKAHVARIKADDERMNRLADVNKLAGGSEECAICLEVIPADAPVVLECSHLFCASCMHKYNASSVASLTHPACPLCRQQMPLNLDQFIYDNAVQFIRQGKRVAYDPNRPDKLTLRAQFSSLAMKEYQKLTASGKNPGVTGRSMLPSVLLLQGKFEEAIAEAESILTTSDEVVQPQIAIDLKATIIECLLCTGNFKVAQAHIHELAKLIFDENDPSRNVREQRTLTQAMSRCDCGLGLFQEAIANGEMCVSMNRHYDRVYDSIVLAHKALRNKEGAMNALKRAIRYETPWDAERREELKAQLAALEAEEF